MRYSAIFHQLYQKTASQEYEYVNDYEKLDFNITGIGRFEEFVFMCPLTDLFTRNVNPFYISKEYNVGPSNELYMPGRFMFGNTLRVHHSYDYSILAEGSARAYTDLTFNVELHYLNLRRHAESGKFCDIDSLKDDIS